MGIIKKGACFALKIKLKLAIVERGKNFILIFNEF